MEIKINLFNTKESFLTFLQEVQSKYGKIYSVIFLHDTDYICRYKSYELCVQQLSDKEYLESNNIKIKCNQSEINVDHYLLLDKEKQNLTIKKVQPDDFQVHFAKKEEIPIQTLEQAMSDENYIYYEFSNGFIGKEEPEGKAYYSLKGNFEWMEDGRLIAWLYDGEEKYRKITKNDIGHLKYAKYFDHK